MVSRLQKKDTKEVFLSNNSYIKNYVIIIVVKYFKKKWF